MAKKNKSQILIKISFFLTFFFSLLFFWNINQTLAIDTCNDGWQVATGGGQKTINCHGVCKIVTNNCGQAIFVPTNTSDEWAEFRSHLPTCVPPLGDCITLPSPPINVICSTVSSSQIDVSWSSVSGATYYEVYRCSGSGCNPTTYIGQTSSISYSNTGLSSNATYSYGVKACNAAGCSSGYSGIPTCTTLAPPASVSCNAISSSQIDVSWSLVSGATSYSIYRCQGSGCMPTTAIANVDNPPYQDTYGLSPGTTYRYRVRSCNADACGYYSSSIATCTTQAAAPPPPPPATVSCSTVSSSQIDVSWGSVSGATYYEVYRCSGSGCNPTTYIGQTSSTSYPDTGLSSSTTYRYRVKACNTAGCSGYSSSIATCTTQAAPPSPPSPPSTISCSTVSSSQIDVSWGSVSGATYYEVYRCQGSGCTPTTYIGQTSSTSYPDTGLSSSTTYRYRVKACNTAGCSGYSSSIATCTTNQLPSPASFGCATMSSSQIDLSWGSVSGATYYEVYYCVGSTCTPTTLLTQTTSLSYSHTGLTPGTNYNYRARACDSGGCSNYTGNANCATETDPCAGGYYTTNWGAGGPGCSSYNQRCYQGVCRTCNSASGGYFYSDGCSGCAGQGGMACWRRAAANTRCSTACTDYGACVEANWNDSSACMVCNNLGGWSCGYDLIEVWAPGYDHVIGTCNRRSSSVSQSCTSWRLAWRRLCVCQY